MSAGPGEDHQSAADGSSPGLGRKGGDGPEAERAALLFMLEDLERSRAQLNRAHKEWLDALDSLHEPVFMHDKDYRVLRSNKAYAERVGMPVKEVVGKPYYEMFPKHDGPLPGCREAIRKEGVTEEEVVLESGEIFLSRASAIFDSDGNYLYSLHIMRDITELKRTARELAEKEMRYRTLAEASHDIIFIIGRDERVRYINSHAAAILGLRPEDAIGKLHADLFPAERGEKQRASLRKVMDSGEAHLFENEMSFPAGLLWLNTWLVPLKDGSGKVDAVMGVSRDVTKRKQAEQSLLNLNRALKTLSACNHELVYASDEFQLLKSMCSVIVELGGYRMAWVGYLEDDAEKSIRSVAQDGFEEGYLENAHISWADTERGRGPTGRAARNGQIQIAQNILTDSSLALWRAEASRRGYASSIALPLAHEDKVFGVLTIYAAQADAFSQDEVNLLREMTEDLAFGIQMLRLRQEQKRTTEQLRKGLEDTVQVVSAMVEMRDPYTAGHERRVAELAVAVATEMGLPEEQVHGLHLAGTIHDLGKIQVPAEILSKPGRLNEVEFSLIKTHPKTGYEILKKIEFPWPIAQMVLQHHERMDGSGYPQGLKGDAILLEARILAVADVVEAMASHRPYRPGLGIESALGEISKNRGKYYDSAVADACLRLFREQGYSLPV